MRLCRYLGECQSELPEKVWSGGGQVIQSGPHVQLAPDPGIKLIACAEDLVNWDPIKGRILNLGRPEF